MLASYDFTPRDNLLVGVEANQTSADYLLPEQDSVNYSNYAAYAQALLDLVYFNFTAGARVEQHSQYGNSFVPRVGLTKVLDAWHFKLLYSRAFKAPFIENIHMNPDIKPEKAQVSEFEIGNKVTDKLMVTANFFDIKIDDTIIYLADPNENYLNAGTVGTRGAEVNCQYRDTWGFVNLGYAYNRVNQNEVALFAVPDQPDRLLGFPAHKVVLSSKMKMWGAFTLNPEVIYVAQRYAFARLDESVQTFAPAIIASLYASFMPMAGLELGMGVHDLANQNPPYLQPYDGGHSPLPGISRELIAKAAYHVEF
jgi:outer membrane cobalamin receptor